MTDIPDISIVVPVYGCDETLLELYKRVAMAAARITASFELIFVDDCGPGHPWELINKLARNDSRVTGLRLTRNFGQHSAIMAGIGLARGNWLIIMDCDLQDRPEEIPRLWAKAQEGHEIVVGRRVKREDGFLKRVSSQFFWWFFGYMTGQENDATQASFGIYSRKVVDVLLNFPEQPLIFPLLVRWAGFKVTAIDITHGRRPVGNSSYSLNRKLSLAVNAIVSYSNKPLKIFISFGFLMAFLSFCYGLWLIAKYLLFEYIVPGWTSVMVSLYFLSGILLLGMGILGLYIGRIFNQVKQRPLYVIKDRTSVLTKDDS